MIVSRFSQAALISAALAFGCSDPTSVPSGHESIRPASAISSATGFTPTRLISGTTVNGVNENGEATGGGPGAVGCGTATSLPKFWRADGSVVVLPLGPGHCGGTGYSVNNSGVIVGQEYGSGGEFAYWTPDGVGGYTLHELEFVNGHLIRVLGGLNDNGEIVGWYNNAEMYWRTLSGPWTLMRPPAGATDCQVRRGINNAGAIVAECRVGSGPNIVFYWANHLATPVALPRPSGSGSLYPTEINDAGVVVGYQISPSKAVRWTPNGAGGYNVSYLPDAGKGAAAYGLARDGTVSGSLVKSSNFFTSTYTPVLWPPVGSYQVLPYSGSAKSGEANDVASLSAGGLVVGGYQDNQAIRWK